MDYHYIFPDKRAFGIRKIVRSKERACTIKITIRSCPEEMSFVSLSKCLMQLFQLHMCLFDVIGLSARSTYII